MNVFIIYFQQNELKSIVFELLGLESSIVLHEIDFSKINFKHTTSKQTAAMFVYPIFCNVLQEIDLGYLGPKSISSMLLQNRQA